MKPIDEVKPLVALGQPLIIVLPNEAGAIMIDKTWTESDFEAFLKQYHAIIGYLLKTNG